MIVPRETTQIITYPAMPVEQDQTVEQLRAVLLGAGQLAAQGLNEVAQAKQGDTQRKQALAKLEDNKARLSQGTELKSLELQLGKERMRTRSLNELMQLTEADRKRLEENERNGALAELWRTPDSELPATAQELGVVSPDNLTEIDRALGERRAMIDYGLLQKQYLLDSSRTPKEHLDQWIGEHPQQSDEQQGAYNRSLTKWVLQDDESARREMIAAGKKVGFENALFNLERQAAIEGRRWSADPKAMESALKDFHAEAAKFNPALSTLDVSNIFATRLLPLMLEGMSGKQQLQYLDQLFKGGKSKYLSALSANQEARTAMVADATRLYQRQQADRSRELAETLSGARTLMEYTIAVGNVATARQGQDISETHWQDLSQKIESKGREIRSRTKIVSKLDGDPAFASEAISGAEQQLFADELKRRQVEHQARTGRPMTFDEQIKLELGTGDLSHESKERIKNLVEAPAMRREDGTLDTTHIEQGIAALQVLRDSAPLYYQQRYIDNRDALTPHMELAVSLLDGGYPRAEVVNWIARIERPELGNAKAALSGDGGVDFAEYLKDKFGTNFLFFRNVGFEFDDQGASKRAVRLAESLFTAYYATSPHLKESQRRKEARNLAAAEVFSRFDRVKINGIRYFYERAAAPVTKEVLEANFAPVAENVAWLMNSKGFAQSSSDVVWDFDNAVRTEKSWNVPILLKGRPTQLMFPFPLDPAEQVEYRREHWNKSIDIVEEWFKQSGFKAKLPPKQSAEERAAMERETAAESAKMREEEMWR